MISSCLQMQEKHDWPYFRENSNAVEYGLPFSTTSFAIALLLVFRTNESYRRWWDCASMNACDSQCLLMQTNARSEQHSALAFRNAIFIYNDMLATDEPEQHAIARWKIRRQCATCTAAPGTLLQGAARASPYLLQSCLDMRMPQPGMVSCYVMSSTDFRAGACPNSFAIVCLSLQLQPCICRLTQISLSRAPICTVFGSSDA